MLRFMAAIALALPVGLATSAYVPTITARPT